MTSPCWCLAQTFKIALSAPVYGKQLSIHVSVSYLLLSPSCLIACSPILQLNPTVSFDPSTPLVPLYLLGLELRAWLPLKIVSQGMQGGRGASMMACVIFGIVPTLTLHTPISFYFP